jgi:hypothetical protein
MYYDETEPTLHRSRAPHNDLSKMILSYKNHRWHYEREWRLFAPDKGEVYYRDNSCVTTVYLGSRISDEHRHAIGPRLAALNIKSRNMLIKKCIFLAERIFGVAIVNSEGKQVPVRYIGEQHVKQDLGRIPTAQDWLSQVKPERWMYGQRLGRDAP